MNVSRVSLLLLAALACGSAPGPGADRIRRRADRLPEAQHRRHADRRLGRHLAGHGQAAGVGASGRPAQPGAARPAVPVMVSELTPPAPDGSPPPTLFARKVDRLAAMGEGESLNEMVRSAGAYVDPGIATVDVECADDVGRTGQRLRHRDPSRPDPDRSPPAPGPPARPVAGDSAGAMAAAPDLRATEPQLATLLQSAASGQPAAGVPAGAARRPRDGDVRSRPRSPAGRGAAVERAADDPRRWSPIARCRSPTRLEIAERGEASGDHRGDATERPLRPGGARRRGHAARRWRGARGSWRLRATPATRTRSCSRSSRSMARRAAARCSPPSRARARPACSPCRPSRNTPTSPRRRCAACCCWATSARRRAGRSSP